MQKFVNAAPTAGEGTRVAGMISVLVGAGIDGGCLVNARLAKMHWPSGASEPDSSVGRVSCTPKVATMA